MDAGLRQGHRVGRSGHRVNRRPCHGALFRGVSWDTLSVWRRPCTKSGRQFTEPSRLTVSRSIEVPQFVPLRTHRDRRLSPALWLLAAAGICAPALSAQSVEYTITTFAGSNSAGAGYTGDGGAALSAQFNNPFSLALDSSKNLFISDQLNSVVRVINSAGTVTTFAGNATPGYLGDGGAAISASMNRPSGIYVDSTGNLYIADNENDRIREVTTDCDYHELARLVVIKPRPVEQVGNIAVVSAGTSDLPVAEEAALTAEILGNRVKRIYDVGVAGIHRLLYSCDDLFQANVAVVAAGMEGALASVVGGLVSCPVIGIPTSVGYGASFGGLAALLSMLNSCASGVSVVNIDNGFGAGFQAALINKLAVRETPAKPDTDHREAYALS